MQQVPPHPRNELEFDQVEQPVSVSHFFSVLTAYRVAIILSVAAVGLAYAIVALSIYILKPAPQITSLAFRLDFKGAAEGTYPNGTKFSTNDILNTPILLKVYEANGVNRYVPFLRFARSIFIVEQNTEYERLRAEYQSRLSDPKLSAIDRERIEKEFDSRSAAVSKNNYSISYLVSGPESAIPRSIVRKVLTDILREWATYAVGTQRALLYDVAIISPSFVDVPPIDSRNYIAALQLLRVKVTQVQRNLVSIAELPGVHTLKTSDNRSIHELRLQLDDLIRFQIEPLITTIRASGLLGERNLVLQLLESQLAYDERRLRAAEQRVNAIREALATYAGTETAPQPADVRPSSEVAAGATSRPTAGDFVMPQLSDSFIDRLTQLTNRAADQSYREKLAEELKGAALDIIPMKEAVDYDRQLLTDIRSNSAKTANTTGEEVITRIEAGRADLRGIIAKINEIHMTVSKNLNPSTMLYSVEGPPATRLQRAASLSRLALYGILTILLSIPLITLACFLHNRVREEGRDAASQFREEGRVAEAGQI